MENKIILSPEESEKFLEMLENPKGPTPAMKEAVEVHKRLMGGWEQQTIEILDKARIEAESRENRTTFILSDKHVKMVEEWLESLKPKILEIQKGKVPGWAEDEVYYGAIGGGVSYIFTPTSIGLAVRAKEAITGEEINLTDYNEW